MKVAVSACLLGRNCKYNGGNNLDERLTAWLAGCDTVEVCPEVEGGLPVPRPPAELQEGRVVNVEGEDVSEFYVRGALRCFERAKNCDIVVLKSKSPSCGVHQVYDGSFSGVLIPGKGVFAAMLEDAGVCAVEPDELLSMEDCPHEEGGALREDAYAELGPVCESSPACAPGSICELGPAHAPGPVYEGDNMRSFPQAMFGTAYVYDVQTEDGDDVRLLEVGGVFESATYLGERRFEPTFEYYRSFDHLFEAFPHPGRVLMLGGGGYSYPKHFIASQPYGAMDVVEIDPVITRIAHEHFYLGELIERFRTKETGRLRIFTSDARAYVEEVAARSENGCYDVVINDSFSGAEPTEDLVDACGLATVKSCLRPGGLLMINLICDLEEDAGALMDLAARLRTAFLHVHVIPCVDEVFGDEDNNLVIATDGDYVFSGCLPPLTDDIVYAVADPKTNIAPIRDSEPMVSPSSTATMTGLAMGSMVLTREAATGETLSSPLESRM